MANSAPCQSVLLIELLLGFTEPGLKEWFTFNDAIGGVSRNATDIQESANLNKCYAIPNMMPINKQAVAFRGRATAIPLRIFANIRVALPLPT